jgi:hypothetical protein
VLTFGAFERSDLEAGAPRRDERQFHSGMTPWTPRIL